MKVFLSLIASLFLLTPASMVKIRSSFHAAEHSLEAAEAFNKLVKETSGLDKDIQLVYEGASETLLAKHGSGISERIALFKEGKKKIETAVQNQPKNGEIRLVRLVIQHKTPAILRYKANLEEDKQFIIANYGGFTADLKKYIAEIIQDTSIFSAEEQEKLK